MSEQSLIPLAHHCPRCHRGRLFAGFMALAPSCGERGLAFERESGQNWGAMALSYAFSAVIALPLFFALLLKGVRPELALGIPVGVLAVVAPLNVRISRLVWAHTMCHLHPHG